MVACLLSFCPSPRIALAGARAAARARGQTSGTMLPAAYSSDGSRENQPALDSAGGAVPSSAADALLHNVSVKEVSRRPRNSDRRLGEGESRFKRVDLQVKYTFVWPNEEKISP